MFKPVRLEEAWPHDFNLNKINTNEKSATVNLYGDIFNGNDTKMILYNVADWKNSRKNFYIFCLQRAIQRIVTSGWQCVCCVKLTKIAQQNWKWYCGVCMWQIIMVNVLNLPLPTSIYDHVQNHLESSLISISNQFDHQIKFHLMRVLCCLTGKYRPIWRENAFNETCNELIKSKYLIT